VLENKNTEKIQCKKVKKMIKFVLIMQICQAAMGVCTGPISDNLHYNSYKECAITGYKKSYEIMNELKAEDLDKFRTIINFYCKEADNA
jgi:hypothetical protein